MIFVKAANCERKGKIVILVKCHLDDYFDGFPPPMSYAPFSLTKLPTSGHKVDRNSFRGQGLYFGLYFVDRRKNAGVAAEPM